MIFSSFVFLFVFLPLCLAAYYAVPRKLKNFILLCFSLCFYAWGTWLFIPIFLASCLVDFCLALAITKTEKHQKKILVLSLILNLGLLIYYKYTNFFLTEINSVLSAFEITKIKWQHIILPIGISFITFQKISYLVDVYRGIAKPTKNPLNYILYISLFPQLIAGPIVRYQDIAEQLDSRKHSLEDVMQGFARFCIGLSKKVLIADVMGNVVSNIDHLPAYSATTGYTWLSLFCYSFQIYFDFSGYSDMAIGLGRMFGFRFLENFNAPYISQTFSEYWRRWHISLSTVMRDYLYIPLGGNRCSTIRNYINLWTVFLISGFWHGANWTYILWGAYHGLFLTFDKLGYAALTKKISAKYGRVINVITFFIFLQIGWVFFKADTIHSAFQHLGYLFNIREVPIAYPPLRGRIISNEAIFIMIISFIICFSPLLPNYEKLKEKLFSVKKSDYFPLLRLLLCLLALFSCSVALSATKFSPFIYFQF